MRMKTRRRLDAALKATQPARFPGSAIRGTGTRFCCRATLTADLRIIVEKTSNRRPGSKSGRCPLRRWQRDEILIGCLQARRR